MSRGGKMSGVERKDSVNAELESERDALREKLNNSCACQHDGRGDLTSECQEHERIRLERDALKREPSHPTSRWVLKQLMGGLGFDPGEAHVASDIIDKFDALKRECEALKKLRPLNEWHEEIGSAIWWLVPIEEPPWVGTPLDSDWPGYHTHWSKIPDVAALSPAEKYPPDHQKLDVFGDCRCVVCRPAEPGMLTEGDYSDALSISELPAEPKETT